MPEAGSSKVSNDGYTNSGNDPCAAVRNPSQAQRDFCVQQGVPAAEIEAVEREYETAPNAPSFQTTQEAVFQFTNTGTFASAKSPLAMKLASGVSTSLSRRMWVRYFGPFTAKTKSSGVSAAHWAYDSGLCSE